VQESLRFYRLAHDSDGACLFGFLSDVGTCGDYNDRNLRKKRILGPLGEKTPSIEYRHHKVQKNQGRKILVLCKQPKCFAAIPGALYTMTLKRQEFRNGLTRVTIIVDKQNHQIALWANFAL